MDSVFAKKSHKSYELARRVESSKANQLAKYLDRVKDEQTKTYDDRHTVGRSLLEVSTSAVEDSRLIKMKKQRQDNALVLKAQMLHRQTQMSAEKMYNENFQAYQEADAASYQREERRKVNNHRK